MRSGKTFETKPCRYRRKLWVGVGIALLLQMSSGLAGASSRKSDVIFKRSTLIVPEVISKTKVQVWRFLTLGRPDSFKSTMAERKYRKVYSDWKARRTPLISALTSVVEAHAGSHTDGRSSLFVSVALNNISLMLQGDDEKGGALDVIRKTSHLCRFNVCVDMLVPVGSEVSRNETELLVLLPPGVSLSDPQFDMKCEPNPYKGWTYAAMKEVARRTATSPASDVFGYALSVEPPVLVVRRVERGPREKAAKASHKGVAGASAWLNGTGGATEEDFNKLPPKIQRLLQEKVTANLRRAGVTRIDRSTLLQGVLTMMNESRVAVLKAAGVL